MLLRGFYFPRLKRMVKRGDPEFKNVYIIQKCDEGEGASGSEALKRNFEEWKHDPSPRLDESKFYS